MGSTSDFSIPIIAFSRWYTVTTPSSQRARGQGLTAALHTGGFFYLTNHGIDETAIDAAFDSSRQFFALSLEEKNAVRHPDGAGEHRGFSEVGRENASMVGDVREVYDSGTEGAGSEGLAQSLAG